MRKILLIVVVLSGCETPLAPPAEPLAVRPLDLVQSYRDQNSIAKTAYDNITVCVSIPVGTYTTTDNSVRWHVASKEFSPVIVFLFNEPIKPQGRLVIAGVCQGRIDDGVQREFSGVEFHITVAECKFVASPRASPAPR